MYRGNGIIHIKDGNCIIKMEIVLEKKLMDGEMVEQRNSYHSSQTLIPYVV